MSVDRVNYCSNYSVSKSAFQIDVRGKNKTKGDGKKKLKKGQYGTITFAENVNYVKREVRALQHTKLVM